MKVLRQLLPCILLITIAVAALALIGFRGRAPETGAQKRTGSLRILVVDGFSDLPLAGASVVIPEFGQTFVTNEKGQTAMIEAPILQDELYSAILPQPWGRVTVLVYAQGYLPYALFYTMVWEDQVRLGPKIYLFPEGSTQAGQPFTVVEAPHGPWVEELLERYRP